MRVVSLVTFVCAGLVGSGCVAMADQDCRHVDARQGQLDASGLREVHVVALGGSLTVQGVQGAAQLEASGRACASSQKLLDQIELRVERKGAVAEVEVWMPETRALFGNVTMRLDLNVTVPAGVELKVTDGSGELEIAGVASVELDDGSGPALVQDISGDVRVEDGSGSLRLERISGTLRLVDGSGEILVRGVRGDVIVEEDGSGPIEIAGVEGSVHIVDDGSGGIVVSDVTGDLVVDDDGSGGVSYQRVDGRVEVSEDD